MPGCCNSNVANALLDPWNIFSMAGTGRALNRDQIKPEVRYFQIFKLILFLGATIGLFSLAARMAAGKLNAHPEHYGIEFIGFAACVALPLAYENKELYKLSKDSHKKFLKAKHAEIGEDTGFGIKGGASYEALGKMKIHARRAEVALIAFKALLFAGFFVAGGLAIAKVITVAQMGIMGLAIGGGYYFGTYFFRAGINYSHDKTIKAILEERMLTWQLSNR